MRNLAELKQECLKNGIHVSRSGKREAKADYEKALAKFYWKRDHGDEPMPPQLHPMLARNVKDLSEDEREYIWQNPRWIAQEKIDGCRLLMFFGTFGNHFTSRRLSDKTYRYAENTNQLPHLANIIVSDLADTVLDGEAVCPKACINTGKTVTLNGLQATVALLGLNPTDSHRVQKEQDCWLVYKVFDILRYRGQDVTRWPLRMRMEKLSEVFHSIKGRYPELKMELVPTMDFSKKPFYEKIVAEGGEGVMLKDLEAPYEASSSRTKAMYKVKRFEELDAFVTNFAPGEVGAGWEKLVGGLEVSCYDELTRALHPVAWVTNLTFEDRCQATVCPQCGQKMVVNWLNENGRRVVKEVYCPEHGQNSPALHKDFYNKVYIVRGQEITARVLRLKHAVIVSDREDKAPEDCTIPLAAWRAKFEGKAEETGVIL